MSLILKAPAKINWFLFVLGRRPDGYHDIATALECIDLFDTLEFEKSNSVEIEGLSSIPLKENLIYKAVSIVKERFGIKKGVSIRVQKTIPIASGLAGGSTDAAATLKGLNILWGLDIDDNTLKEISISLGSDVPFFLDGLCALAEGKGHILTPIPTRLPCTLLLVKPPIGVSSGWAYSETKRYYSPKKSELDSIIRAISERDFGVIKEKCSNGLEPSVFRKYPLISEIKERLYAEGAVFSIMSGSGSTVFGVFEDELRAERAEGAFKGLWTKVVKTLTF